MCLVDVEVYLMNFYELNFFEDFLWIVLFIENVICFFGNFVN